MKKNIEVKRPPLKFAETQKVIKTIQEKLNAPVLAYWTSANGSVCDNDTMALRQVLEQVGPGQRLYYFVKSDGGNGRASLRMVHLLREFFPEVIALVPLNAQSAATLLVLGANEIHMGTLAHLSAVDTSITHDLSPVDKDNDRVRVGQNELHRIIGLWNKENAEYKKNPYDAIFQYIHPLVIGAVDRASSLSTMLCEDILSYHMENEKKRKKISEILNNKYPSHGYPIVLREAIKIGLNAKKLDKEVDDLLLELNELYSEMGQYCKTDYDEMNYHDNEILNIHEVNGMQIFFQVDKDWHFRQSDRTWLYTNEKSSWKKCTMVNGELTEERFHIR
ncbi:MAG: hypothetical protein K1Y36_03795 [Blastocatellia bacterium]|nr:hypothetical protein [Blastocatellia bacterium]